jgi:putative Ca2+/H+ antiporter (TMEM165/GDT1 family)
MISHFPLMADPFFLSFVLIFVAELGDKTLYTILLLSSRHRALPVLLGSCAAFVVQGAIALALGSVLNLLPHAVIRWVTVVVFAFFGLRLLLMKEEAGTSEVEPAGHRVALAAFLMVMAAEWGDASQLGTAALVAHLHAPVKVVLGATAGLWAGTLLAVVVGRTVGRKLPAHLLRRCAGVLFCIFAFVSAVRG